MQWVILIIATIAIFIGGFLFARKRNNTAFDNGEIVNRDKGFMRQVHKYETNVDSIDQIYDKMDKDVLKTRHIKYSLIPMERVEFSITQVTMTTYFCLNYDGYSEGTYHYSFFSTKIANYRGSAVGKLEENVALTAVERAILALDETALVQRVRGNFK